MMSLHNDCNITKGATCSFDTIKLGKSYTIKIPLTSLHPLTSSEESSQQD